ncbi:MAG: hypothetical protein R2707_08055 [Acidimicrobiales bacterium]
MTRVAGVWLGLGALFVLLLAIPAGANELISIPIDEVIYGREGDEILVGGADVPAELVGVSCEMTGETVNQESVHVGNDLVIRLGDQTRVLANFEDERDIRYTFSEIAELPERIDVFVRLGPDGVSSGGFLISIECEIEPPTTTSTTTTTTSTSTTTTTTTTVGPTSTSTTTSTTTTAPSSTTLEPTTTTIQVAGPTTSLPPGSTSSVDLPPGQLAITGAGTGLLALAWLGLGMCAVGTVAAVHGSRPRSRA